ncbi:MAG: sigma-70 family RNA polymerase sigma factor, partial [Oscillospiraceae bacterium]
RRYLRDNSAVRVSRSLRDLAYKVMQTREALLSEHQKDPSVDDIAKALNIPVYEVVLAMDAMSDPVSLFDPVYGEAGESVSVMDKVCDTKNTDASWLERIALSEAVDKLGEREKRILAMRFFEGRTQMEVASAIGISQAQVSRLEKTAVGQIKKELFPV